jgi:hypothetical protein
MDRANAEVAVSKNPRRSIAIAKANWRRAQAERDAGGKIISGGGEYRSEEFGMTALSRRFKRSICALASHGAQRRIHVRIRR